MRFPFCKKNMNRLIAIFLICLLTPSCSIKPDAGDGGPVTESLEIPNIYDSKLSREEGIAMLRRALANNPEGVHERDYDGSTPLLYACSFENGDYIKAKILLEAGADPLAEHQTQTPCTPLHIVARRDNLSLVKLLLHYVPENKNDKIIKDPVYKWGILDWAPNGSKTSKWLLANGYQRARRLDIRAAEQAAPRNR